MTRPVAVFAVLAAAVTAYSMMQSLVIPALPEMQRELGVSAAGVSWVVTALLLSSVVATPTLGRVGDLRGTRTTLLAVLGVLVAGTVLCAIARSLPLLIAGRVLHGIGAAVFPLAFAIVRRTMPAARIPWAFGFLSAMLGVGGAVGVPLGGLIAAHAPYQAVFWVLLPVYVAVFVLAWRLVPGTGGTHDGRLDVLGGTLLGLGLAAFLVAVTEAPVWGAGAPRTLAFAAAALVLLALWLVTALRLPAPMIDPRDLVRPTTWRAHLISFGFGAGLYCSFALLPGYLQAPPGSGPALTAQHATLLLLPFPVAMTVVGFAAGRLVRRVGAEAVLLGGGVAAVGGFVVLLATPSADAAVGLATAAVGAGCGAGFSVLPSLVTREAREGDTGGATGVNTVMRYLGGAVVGQLAAALVTGVGYGAGFAAGLVAMLAALGLAATVRAVPQPRACGDVVVEPARGKLAAPRGKAVE